MIFALLIGLAEFVVIGLAAIAGAYYEHNRRGGTRDQARARAAALAVEVNADRAAGVE